MEESFTFLHVGCGGNRKSETTVSFNTPEWRELRFDIDPVVEPDIIGTMTDMSAVADGSMDAVFSSHNLEHLYVHEVPLAVREFLRVLRPNGFAVLTCPDLQSVCELVAQEKLLEPAYQSASGPIAPLDILYGFRRDLARGNLFMAHRSGFTKTVLLQLFRQCGFAQAIVMQRTHPFYDLWLLAVSNSLPEDYLRELVDRHFPREKRGKIVGEF
jgi:SAM-dependent methyltransferase